MKCNCVLLLFYAALRTSALFCYSFNLTTRNEGQTHKNIDFCIPGLPTQTRRAEALSLGWHVNSNPHQCPSKRIPMANSTVFQGKHVFICRFGVCDEVLSYCSGCGQNGCWCDNSEPCTLFDDMSPRVMCHDSVLETPG